MLINKQGEESLKDKLYPNIRVVVGL